MSLTSGTGPFSGKRAGRFSEPVPEHVVYVEPFLRRIRAVAGGRTLIDSERALLVHRPGHPPTWAFPADEVEALTGEPVPEAPGHVQVPWDAVDAWYEEDEEVFLHPRNPYHRVDCLRTSRRLHVEVAGTVLVDTDETIGVFETALAPRLYVRRDLIRMDLLVPSGTTTYCPYKGTTTYFNAVIGDAVVADVAFSYEDPYPECLRIAGLLSFEPERVDVRDTLLAG